jgi:hypothetical protein
MRATGGTKESEEIHVVEELVAILRMNESVSDQRGKQRASEEGNNQNDKEQQTQKIKCPG